MLDIPRIEEIESRVKETELHIEHISSFSNDEFKKLVLKNQVMILKM